MAIEWIENGKFKIAKTKSVVGSKTYLVLTPEKVEDIFMDLESSMEDINFSDIDLLCIRIILESKKQELLKSIK